jgi:hypothetical protein
MSAYSIGILLNLDGFLYRNVSSLATTVCFVSLVKSHLLDKSIDKDILEDLTAVNQYHHNYASKSVKIAYLDRR